MSSLCGECGAKITWVKSPNGTDIPLNFPGEKRIVVDDERCAHVIETFISHLATCKDCRKGE